MSDRVCPTCGGPRPVAASFCSVACYEKRNDDTPPHGIERPRLDQLDVQCEMARRAIRARFEDARRRVAEWEPGRG